MRKMERVQQELERLNQESVSSRAATGFFGCDTRGMKLSELLARPDMEYADFSKMGLSIPDLPGDVTEQVQIRIKYAGYIKKQAHQVERFKSVEGKQLPSGFDYAVIPGLRIEAKLKLNAMKPANIGQASRISGVSPADISVLLVYFSKGIARETAQPDGVEDCV
jgi:tRNA uridine 5-carboxymethylaminomethyl modification enzyme